MLVLPAPSGPIRPNSSPLFTDSETLSTAMTFPLSYFLVSPFKTTDDLNNFTSAFCILHLIEFHLSVHSYLQRAIIGHFNFYCVHKVSAFFLSLNCFRSKLCLVANP